MHTSVGENKPLAIVLLDHELSRSPISSFEIFQDGDWQAHKILAPRVLNDDDQNRFTEVGRWMRLDGDPTFLRPKREYIRGIASNLAVIITRSK